MCGLNGIYNLNGKPADSFLIQKMNNVLNHRGPDDKGCFCFNQVGLGHTRLSIIDLSQAGHQPMSNDNESLWIVYNGEIYNFQEIRKSLQALGYKFKSETDTEVILFSYQEWGVNCLEKFNGMFAFAIWDKNKEQLFLARDRLGQKPLYYYYDQEKFVFASEIKAILENKNIKREINPQGMVNYFTFGNSIGPDTIYKNIKKLLPGNYLILKKGKIEINNYWRPYSYREKDQGEKYYLKKLTELFENSVKQRLISDVPLGVFLSGGIDSSAVVAMMAKSSSCPIKTFSVGFNIEGKEFNELPDAKLVADYFKTEHHEIILKELDLINTLNKLVYHFDEPFGDAANFPVFYISQFAKDYITVALTGEGGDEIFAGYRRYVIEKNRSLIMLFNWLFNNSLAEKSINFLPGFRRTKKFIETLPVRDDLLRYASWLDFFSQDMRKYLFKDYLLEDSLKIYKKYFFEDSSYSLIEKFINLDQKILLPDRYLEKIDKASMAVGLETRTPFLDHNLVDFVNSMPLKYNIKGFKTKCIFKEAMKDFLPSKIIKKRKHGFAVPTNLWFRGKLKDYLFEVIFDSKTKSRGYFNFDYIEKLYKHYQEKNQPFDSQLWLILNFELWHRKFIDNSAS